MPCESGFGPEQSKRATGKEVGPKIEGVVDGGMSGEEALR